MKKCSDKECENEFIQYKSTDKYCSFKCYNKNRKVDLTLKSPISKSKKCKICKNNFTPKNIVTEPVCQNYECRLSYALKIVDKNKLEKEKEDKKIKNEVKKQQKDALTNWKNQLQDSVNLIARLIDKDLPCLAKGKYANQFHGGHIFSRGSNPTMRYNLHNIHRQSAQSNHFQNEDGLLREGLIKEYGQHYMDFISELRRTETLRFTNEDFHKINLKARKIILKLKKLDKTYSLKQRIELRNQINTELEVYNEEYCIFNDSPKLSL